MVYKNLRYNKSGGIDLDLNHETFGWIPFTAMPDSKDDDVEKVWQAVKDDPNVADFEPDFPTDQAIARGEIDTLHAQFLSGHWTPEEQITWSTKEAAAKAILAGSASSDQKYMIETEANGRGITPAKLAKVITEKVANYRAIIGMGGKIRSQARVSIAAAETQPDLDTAVADAKTAFEASQSA